MGLVAEEMLGRVILEGIWTKYSKLHTFVCKLGGQKENTQEKWNYCSNTQKHKSHNYNQEKIKEQDVNDKNKENTKLGKAI